jgi:DNA replication and repair protein RecF
VACADVVDAMRARYLRRLEPHFLHLLSVLSVLEKPHLHYRRGWSSDLTLDQVLKKDRARDTAHGSTHNGPQRADIDFTIEGRAAEDVLSRGQKKILACAFRLAQGVLLHELTGKTCIYLIDDLPAELDTHHRQLLCHQLSALHSQVFVTATDPHSLRDCWPKHQETVWFHVEHGRITTSNPPWSEY